MAVHAYTTEQDVFFRWPSFTGGVIKIVKGSASLKTVLLGVP